MIKVTLVFASAQVRTQDVPSRHLVDMPPGERSCAGSRNGVYQTVAMEVVEGGGMRGSWTHTPGSCPLLV